MLITDILTWHKVNYKIQGNEVIMVCVVPDCPDTKGHLYFNVEYNVWICFRCGHKGNIESFLYWFNKKYNTDYKVNKFKGINTQLTKKEDIKENQIEPYIPLWKIKKETIHKKYLKNRGVTEDKWIMFDIGVSISKKNLGDLVFPVKFNGNIIGLHYKNIQTGRFQSFKNAHKYLYNYDLARRFTKIFVVEGVFDCIKLVSAVGLFGKTISKNQAILLRNLNADLYLALDGDTEFTERYKEARKIAMCKRVFIVHLPYGKDPDDYTAEELFSIATAI